MPRTKPDPKPVPEKPSEVVLVPFAYAAAKDGEVVQLVKGVKVDPDRFKGESLAHLRSIGFIGIQN